MVLIALGGNSSSHVGPPELTLKWAIGRMTNFHINVISCSSFYRTKSMGQNGRDVQQDYINAVIRIQTSLSGANLLKNLKQIENTAGRNNKPMRIKGRWGSRPLDLDIVDYKGLVSPDWPVISRYIDRYIGVTSVLEMRRRPLITPHPQAHLRPFVIRPLLDIYPLWHHPVNGLSVRSLWVSLRAHPDGQVLCKLS